MYAKLIFKNAKRSAKDYLIYIVTMTICVTLFYAFLSISSSYYNPDIGSEYDFTLLSDGMKSGNLHDNTAVVILDTVCQPLYAPAETKRVCHSIYYGNGTKDHWKNFLRRNTDYGIDFNSDWYFFGVFCSQFITAMLLTAYEKPYEISWTLFPDTVLWTVAFFVFSFLVVGIFNTRTIQKTKIITMLSAEKENEPEPGNSRWISVAVIFFELITVWALITGIQKVWFYYDARFAFPVRLMYWGNILFPLLTLLLVCIFA